jgi:hypothetical protein
LFWVTYEVSIFYCLVLLHQDFDFRVVGTVIVQTGLSVEEMITFVSSLFLS